MVKKDPKEKANGKGKSTKGTASQAAAQTTAPRTRAPNKKNPDSEWLKSEFLPKHLKSAIAYGRSKEAARQIQKFKNPPKDVFDFWLEDSKVIGNREALVSCFLHGYNLQNGEHLVFDEQEPEREEPEAVQETSSPPTSPSLDELILQKNDRVDLPGDAPHTGRL